MAAFSKRFPGLKLEHVRDTGGNTVGGRIVQESQGDTRTADVATTGAAIFVPLQERKLIKAVDWNAYGLSKELAPTPYGVVVASVIYVIVYNTDARKRGRRSEDLGRSAQSALGRQDRHLGARRGARLAYRHLGRRPGSRLRPQDERAPSRAAAEHVSAGAAGRGRRTAGRLRAQSHRTAADPARRADQGGFGRPGADQHALQHRSGQGEESKRRRAAGRVARDARKAPRSTRMRPIAATPIVPGTKTYAMLQGHKTSQFSVGEQANEAAIVNAHQQDDRNA